MNAVGDALPVVAGACAATAVWLARPTRAGRGVHPAASGHLLWLQRLQSLRPTSASSRCRDIAALTSALATELRAGRSPESAWITLQNADDLRPVLAVDGADIPIVLRRWAQLPGWGGLAAVAVVWQLSDASGAGLADALDRVGEAMQHEDEVTAEVRSQLVAARATAATLAALPVLALGLGGALGADPFGILLHTQIGLACLATGACLSVLGWWWIHRQVAQVQERLQW